MPFFASMSPGRSVTDAGGAHEATAASGTGVGARIYLDGGETVRRGRREHAVDRLTLSMVPALLSAGRPGLDESVPRSR